MPKKIKVGILTNKTGAHVGAYLNAPITAGVLFALVAFAAEPPVKLKP